MPAYCFDFNVYKQANVNMDIRSWQHYKAITFLYHQDNVYPCADPGNFRRVWRWGVQAQLTEKKALTFFFLCFFCKSSAYFAEGVQRSCRFQRKLSLTITFRYSMEKDGSTFPGVPTFPRGRGSNCIFLYKPIEFVIFQGAGVWTPTPSSGSSRCIVNWVRPHIVLAKRHSMTLTPLMQVLCGWGKQRQGPTV